MTNFVRVPEHGDSVVGCTAAKCGPRPFAALFASPGAVVQDMARKTVGTSP